MNRAKRLLVFALVCYTLMDLGMRLYVFGPSFVSRWWYGFTEGGTLTVTQRIRHAVKRPWFIWKGQIKSQSTAAHLPSWRSLFVRLFRSVEWRLDSSDPLIRAAALTDLDRAEFKVKMRVARHIGERLSTTDPPSFSRDLSVLVRLGSCSRTALPPVLSRFPNFDPYFQLRLIDWFASLKSDAFSALPLLWEELNGLDKKEIHFFRLSCGTPPLPEYLSPELSRAARVIQAILAIDPETREALLSKLHSLLETDRKDLAYFCHHEIGKITIPPSPLGPNSGEKRNLGLGSVTEKHLLAAPR